jgi:hypothetical protein
MRSLHMNVGAIVIEKETQRQWMGGLVDSDAKAMGTYLALV